MSPTTDAAEKPIHLWVLHHGLWGHPDHLTLLAKTILDKASQTGESVQVLNIAVNSGTWTYAGVDGCGAKTVRIVTERLADASKPRISHISFAGYSLGGLILRYAIGVLYAHGVFANPSQSVSLNAVSNELGFSPVIAHKFVTFASPHLGTYNPNSANSGLYFRLASFLLARPGAQMLHQDRTGLDNRKMINVLADPALPFFQGLALFEERILYGNIINDNMVGHRTSTLLSVSPQKSLEKQYIYTLPAINPDTYPSIVLLKSPIDLSISAASTSLAVAELKPTVGEIIARGAWSVCFVAALTLQRWYWIGLQMYDGWTQNWRNPVSSNGPTGLLKLLSPSNEPSDWLKSWPSYSNEASRMVSSDLVQENDGDAYAFEQLNRLTWQRLHVRSKERRAHASIVGRINGNEDVVRHFGDTFLGAEKHRV
ncbi:putative serine esterase-domain-containing protein [Chytriomyces cf. hyalinus JEL632]|nr:putative serine esterase-domain-containing protein [Chytriomyces cf. hyalinus JEL632]